MLPQHFSIYLQPTAVAFLDSCADEEAIRVRALIEEIRQDPSVDEQRKIAVVIAPIVFRVLVAEGYWIAYHMAGQAEIWVVAIKRSQTAPTSYELRGHT